MNLIYGRAGTGKTEYIFRNIEKKLSDKKIKEKIYIITPEQFSFTAEKQLLRTLEDKATTQVEVLSFERMAYKVIKEKIGNVNRLEKSAKSMIIYDAIINNKKKLNFVGKSLENIDMIITQITEFKKHNITIEKLEKQVNNTKDKYLKAKLSDMLIMYKELENKIPDGYIDENDLLSLLAENIEDSHLFDNCYFYIDEFSGFTKQEFSVIEKLNKIGKELYVTFCIDDINENEYKESDIFYDNKESLKNLLKICKLDKAIKLERNYRFKNDELKHIEQNLFANLYKRYDKEIKNVELELLENKYKEVENVAIKISKLVREENYRYEDIAVICNDIESYSSLFNAIFSEYDIPVFIDEKKDVTQNNIIKYVLSIFEIFSNNFTFDSVFNYLKTGYVKVSNLYELENYCLKWGIKGNRFYKEKWNYEKIENYDIEKAKSIYDSYINKFISRDTETNDDKEKILHNNDVNKTISKDTEINEDEQTKKVYANRINLEFPIDSEQMQLLKENDKAQYDKKEFEELTKEEQLEIINFTKDQEKITKDLLDLKESLSKDKTAYQISKNIYDYLIKQDIAKTDEEKTALNLVIDILIEIANVFKDKKMSFDEYAKVLKTGISTKEIGQIPSRQDLVTIGDVNRTKTHKVRCVFIIGVNDGVFPKINSSQGFFNDKDRNDLKEADFELAKGTKEKNLEENFNIYKAFSTAEEKLFISYVASDNDGKALRKSLIISSLKRIFPLLKEKVITEKSKTSLNNEKSKQAILSANQELEKKHHQQSLEDNREYKSENNEESEKSENSNLHQNLITGNEILDDIPYEVITKETTFEKLLLNLDNPEWKEVFLWYKNNEKEKLQIALNGINYKNVSEKINEENINQLYGNNLKTSISRLEKYRECPFSYYLTYGLNLSEKEKFEIKPIDTGSFMHEIIDGFFKQINEEGLLIKDIDENKIKEIVNRLVEEKITNGGKFNLTAKYRALTTRLKRVIFLSLKYIVKGLQQSEFHVLGTELEFDEKETSKYPPVVIKLENGKKITLRGKIDRVDIAKLPDGKYIRVIDYKSSAHDIELNKLISGLQLQLITYVDVATKNEDALPAGAFYFTLSEPKINEGRLINLSSEEIEKKIRENYKMEGLILADVNVIKAMDETIDKTSNQIHVKLDSAGENIDKRSSKNAVTREDFEKLQAYSIKLLKQISKEIMSGNIEIKPYYLKGTTPCTYCKYRSICNFDSKNKENNYRFIPQLKEKDILDKI